MTPPTSEDLSSQLPALRTLIGLGYTYLTAEEAMRWRGNSTGKVLLESVLRDQLLKLNPISAKGEEFALTSAAVDEVVRHLRDVSLRRGLSVANAEVYDILTDGHTVKQTHGGDTKSYTIRYVDWIDWTRNAFHVVEEFSVRRGGRSDHYRPDIVLFVNGIPFAVLEAKAPHLEHPLREAIRQHARNQQDDGIRPLYKYVQLVGAIAAHEAKYATVATPEEYWSVWRETPRQYLATTPEVLAKAEREAQNAPLRRPDMIRLSDAKPGEEYAGRERVLAEALQHEQTVTEQTKLLVHVFRPARLLELAKDFTLFDEGIRKVARYQQYFAVKATLDRVLELGPDGRREGGVVWHTQGSGKSLTMVMLARALLEAPSLMTREVQIIIVTDRVDLDDQIYRTFLKTGLTSDRLHQAKTGKQLERLMSHDRRQVITTIINKFETVIKQMRRPVTSPDVFVLIDEGHRTQYGRFGASLQRSLPNACAIAFTGTPIRKKRANTTGRFGDYIDKYRIGEAVADGAVVELIYEDRYPLLEVNEGAIKTKYDSLTANMSSAQLAEFDRQNLQKKLWLATSQRLEMVVDDIYDHYTKHWIYLDSKGDGTGRRYRAQLVTQSKLEAVRYYNLLRKKEKVDFGRINVGLLISAPDMREGHEDASEETNDEVIAFWKTMMDRYGREEAYSRALINGFKYGDSPDIIIVVDKLLTGFDAPFNTILYLDKTLKDHTLLQAITRVNRTAENKQYGYLIDYRGVLVDLNKALASQYEEEEAKEVLNAFRGADKELDELPQKHADVAQFFAGLDSQIDLEAFQKRLREPDVRHRFYRKLRLFIQLMHAGQASATWLNDMESTTAKQMLLARYKRDMKFWLRLREIVQRRFSEHINFGAMEGEIRRILDAHIDVTEIQRLGDPVNIFDEDALQRAVEEFKGDEAKADKIASEVSRHFDEYIDRSKTAYQHYAAQLKAIIDEYRAARLSAAEYLQQVQEVRNMVVHGEAHDRLSHALRERPRALVLHSNLRLHEAIKQFVLPEGIQEQLSGLALALESTIESAISTGGRPIVDWQRKADILSDVELAIFDLVYDSPLFANLSEKPTHAIAKLARDLVEVAKSNFQ